MRSVSTLGAAQTSTTLCSLKSATLALRFTRPRRTTAVRPRFDFANAVLASQPSGLGFSKELRPIKPSASAPTSSLSWIHADKLSSLSSGSKVWSTRPPAFRHRRALSCTLSGDGFTDGTKPPEHRLPDHQRRALFRASPHRDFAAQLRFASNLPTSRPLLAFPVFCPKLAPRLPNVFISYS